MSVTCICVMVILGLFPAEQPYRAAVSLVGLSGLITYSKGLEKDVF